MTRPRIIVTAVAVAAALTAAPTLAEAQRRRPVRGPVVRSYVYVGPYVYPRYYSAWWYQWGHPYRYQYPYPPYGYGLYNAYASSVRIQVTPREADVFVDGYRAGKVDDFDGVFQRLRLRPGGHEITIFLEGYETVREAIYLEAGAERKLQFSLNKLAAGERSEPPPSPSPSAYGDDDSVMPGRAVPRRLEPQDEREIGAERSQPSARFGTLSLRVQPGDAEILIDGERWTAPGNQDRISIELTEGRHRVEVRRQGMSTYSEDVLIRRGATMTLNVSLK